MSTPKRNITRRAVKNSNMEKLKETKPIDAVFDFMQKHPYLCVILACAFLLPFGMCQDKNLTQSGIALEAVVCILGTGALVFFGKPSKNKAVNIYLFISSLLLIVLFSLMVSENHEKSNTLYIAFLIWAIQLAVVMYREKSLTADRIVALLIALGVVIRYSYALRIDCQTMQHDVFNFTGTSGHEGYIMYWYNNGLKLPDFDVRTLIQYYHPPLHHILMAFLLRIFTEFGIEMTRAQEALQILPMLYSSLAMVVCCRIFRLCKLKGAGMVVAMTIVCLHPTFIIWSGAYNNDMLSVLFMLLAMLFTLKWYQQPTILRILPIAVCIGCGMMTKLSAWMVAPAVAIVFLVVLIKNIRKPLPFIGQYAAFGAVCVPLGLWWGIRNMIAFDVPITYVWDTKVMSMYVGNIPTAQRLFDFSLHQFDYPFEGFQLSGAPFNEYNPLIGLLKTSLFDELKTLWDFEGIATALVIIAGLIAVACFVGLIYALVSKKSGMDGLTKVFLAVILLTIMIFYYVFCFQFPYVCTENIRYCMPIIPILALGLGFGANAVADKIKHKTS